MSPHRRHEDGLTSQAREAMSGRSHTHTRTRTRAHTHTHTHRLPYRKAAKVWGWDVAELATSQPFLLVSYCCNGGGVVVVAVVAVAVVVDDDVNESKGLYIFFFLFFFRICKLSNGSFLFSSTC